MLSPRQRLAIFWLSQAARILADWGLRITAFLEVRSWGGAYANGAWHLITALFIAPAVLLAPFHGSITNSLPKRWVLVGACAFCLLAQLAFVPSGGPWVYAMALLAIGASLHTAARYASFPAAAQDTRLPLNTVNGIMETGAAAAIVTGMILGLSFSEVPFAGMPLAITLFLVLNVVALLTSFPLHFRSDVRRPEPPLRGLRNFFRDGRRVFGNREARSSLLSLAVFQGIVAAGSGALFTQVLQGEEAGRGGAMLALTLVCLGVSLGCALAALQGNPRRSLGLVPLGVTGLLFAEVWAAWQGEGVMAAFPALLLGVTAGLTNTPLRSTYLGAVPADARGNATSVMNFTVYATTTCMALLIFSLIQSGWLPTTPSQLWFLAALAGVGVLTAWRFLWLHTLEQMVEWLLIPMYRVRTRGPGAGNIPQRGPLLLIANHACYLDPFFLGMIAPRHVTPLMTHLFFDLPIVRWLMVNVVGAIRVQTGIYRREAPELQQAIDLLRKGGCVLLFPEGALRRKDDQLLLPFGQGVWHILQAVPETPVVVCWIEGNWGSYASYHNGPPLKNKRLDWGRRITIAVTSAQILSPDVLVDHRTTRRYLMQACLQARQILGLETPAVGADEIQSVPSEALPPSSS